MKRREQFSAGIGDNHAPQGEAPAVTATIFAGSHDNRSVAHELTRILPERGVRYVAQPDDAPALLRLVEAQARDLVKLRRALVGANSLAEERRKIIERRVVPAGERSPKASPRQGKRGMLRKVRKIGRKLGPATAGFLQAFAGIGLIGRRKDSKAEWGVRTDKKFGYGSLVEYSTREFLEACRSFGTDLILDVGANKGQFAQSLRACGYSGHIVSFEPLSDAHAALVGAAANDALWDVVERCAVGAVPGETQINIAGNSYSSSLLPMLDRHCLAAPDSMYRGVESCCVITLDDYVERTFSDPTAAFGLKIDTQGYEAQVLKGLERNLPRIKVIMCEMSLVPLYEGAPSMQELCRLLAEAGYRCAAAAPEFEDPETGELLQLNGIFILRSPL